MSALNCHCSDQGSCGGGGATGADDEDADEGGGGSFSSNRFKGEEVT